MVLGPPSKAEVQATGRDRWPFVEHVHRYLRLSQKRKILLNPKWWSLLLRTKKLPPDVRQYLQASNPRLLDLASRYVSASSFESSFWKAKSIDLLNFRGEWNYLAQLEYKETEKKYLMTAAYAAAVDNQRFLDRLSEDSLFGAITIRLANELIISRDLLDSVLELSFLSRHLKLDPEQRYVCLDIGAGYGRLAHRFTTLFPKSQVYCVDGVATSTFLCEFYIRFRGFADRAESIPLDEMSRLSNIKFNLATNIHSWSECPLSAVKYWLGLLADLRVPYLFVVPNWLEKEQMFLTIEPDGNRVSFLPEIERHGYRRKVIEQKFGDSSLMATYGIFNAPYILFERRA
jgi:putative sugar O-methyltransferase